MREANYSSLGMLFQNSLKIDLDPMNDDEVEAIAKSIIGDTDYHMIDEIIEVTEGDPWKVKRMSNLIREQTEIDFSKEESLFFQDIVHREDLIRVGLLKSMTC